MIFSCEDVGATSCFFGAAPGRGAARRRAARRRGAQSCFPNSGAGQPRFQRGQTFFRSEL